MLVVLNLIFLPKEDWFATLLDVILFCQKGSINSLLQIEEIRECSLTKLYKNLCFLVGDRHFLTDQSALRYITNFC